jgi:hypothetical protein
MTTEVKELLLAVDQPMTADFISFEEECLYYDMGSVQMIWSGADGFDARLIPQASNDKVNWCNLLPSTQIKKVDETDGCQLYQLIDIGYKYYRVKFEKNSNATGLMTILSVLKRRRGPGG